MRNNIVMLFNEERDLVVTPAFSVRVFVAEDRVCPQNTVYGICGGPCGSVASVSPSTLVARVNYYSTSAPC
jgi:hypothetical protein